MDGSGFSCCLRNRRTSGLSGRTVTHECTVYSQDSKNLNPIKPACTSCSRNFIKCKPWRRKSKLSTTLRWTWFNASSCLNPILLLASLSHIVLHILSRTISTKKTSRLRLDLVLLMASFFGGIFLPLASGQESLQPTPSVKSQLSNAVVYVGSPFSYNISTSVFDCEVDSIVVSETADRFLSHWLSYNSKRKQLYGVPSDKDAGTFNILVVALTKDGAIRGHVCGSKSFSIVVMPVSEVLPVSVHFGTGASRSYHKSAHSLSCVPGTQAVLGTVILNADMHGLNGHERMVVLLKMADHLNIHASKVSFFSGETSHPMTQHLENPAVMAAGVGDGRFAKGSRSLLTWNIGCGAFKLEDAAFSRLETDAQDGTISTLLGFPVVGWHVMSGAQKNMARDRVRRAAVGIGNTPTPTATSAPPTRMSNVSTMVITSRTVTLTSAFSVNSTIRSSISATSSSVAPNRTVVESSGVSINSTMFSQSGTRTIQPSTLSVNLTVSSQSPNRTDVQSSSVSINVTASSQLFSRTVIQSSSAANLSSKATTFSPSSILSSPILTQTLTVNSSTAVMSSNTTQVFNETLSSATTPSLNSTFITRTATTGIPSPVTIISSLSLPTTTRERNSTSIASSPNKSETIVLSSTIIQSISTSRITTSLSNVTTLVPSTPQVNSSTITGTPIFTKSSNTTSMVSSTSLLSSTSRVLITTSVTVISSSQLNLSTLNVTLPILTRQPTPTVKLSSSSVAIANTSAPVTASVNQTSLPTISKASNSSSLSSLRLTSTFSPPSSSRLVSLIPNTTSVGNVTSSDVTRSFVTSPLTALSSTPQLGSTTVLNRTSPILTSTLFPSSVVPTMSSTGRSFTTTSSLVPSSLNSSVMLSSSLISPSSSLASPSSSPLVNMTTVVGNVTSTTLQPNVTSTAVVLPSLTASPLVTSLNLTSVTITMTMNTSTTKRTALVNSTSLSKMSTVLTLTTSARTNGTRTFPSTVATTSEGVDKSSVNITSTSKLTTTTLLLSSESSFSSLSTFQLPSVVPSSLPSPSFTKLSNSSAVTVSASSEARVNSTAVSRTQESSSVRSSAVTRLANSSVSTQRTLFSSPRTVSSTVFVVNSTFVPSTSRQFTNTSSLVLPSSETMVVPSTILLPNASSFVTVLKTSATFSSTLTAVESSLLNSSSVFTDRTIALTSSTILTTVIVTGNRTVTSATEVSLTRTTPLMSSSLVTSTLKSQSLTTVFRSSGSVKTSEILQDFTTVLSTNATVSPSSSSLLSSSSLVLRSSTFSIALPTTATVKATSATLMPTFTTVIPTSSLIQNATTTSSFSRRASPSSASTSVLTRSTLQTEFSVAVNSTQRTRTFTVSTRESHSSSRLVSVSSRIPSSIQPSVTVTPTSRLSVNRTTSIVDTSGTLPSSSALPSSNTTQTVTATDTSQTVSVLPSSSVPTTPPPNFPPVLLNNIGRVQAPAGKALHYTIPDDTFYDREDRATTRNLSLSIKLANGNSIPRDFWLQFDDASQTINGLPLTEHVPDGTVGEVFVLEAEDKNRLQARDAFEVFVVPSEKPVVQELRVRTANEFAAFSRNVSQRLALLKKIADYYGDADESNIRVLGFTSGSVIMTWTNDSLPTDRCDQEKVQYVANKMLLPNGVVKEEFAVALRVQGFPVESVNEERFGVCNGSYIVTTEQPIDPAKQQSKMEEHLWYKHVLVGVLIVLVIIVLAVLLIWCYRRRRPKPSSEKRTFKKRKPIVLEPEIELKPIPGKPLVLPEDDPSFPPSYISETSLDKPVYSDDEDEEDYGKRNPGVVYEPPPPFYQAADDDDPRSSPPPAYLMPPLY